MAYIDIWSMLGFNNNATMFMEAFRGVSNVILTDNPQFTQDDFKSIFPIFPIGVENPDENGNYIPEEVFTLFMLMANKAIKYDRYKSSWKYLMCLYIAHMMTLYMQTLTNPEDVSVANALKGALPTGIATSKSVDGLSISYDLLGTTGMDDYGTWALTKYGQQLITMTRIFGHGGMWVNG